MLVDLKSMNVDLLLFERQRFALSDAIDWLKDMEPIEPLDEDCKEAGKRRVECIGLLEGIQDFCDHIFDILDMAGQVRVFEVILPGFKVETAETDDLVKWVKAPSLSQAQRAAIEKWGTLQEIRPLSYYPDDRRAIDLEVK